MVCNAYINALDAFLTLVINYSTDDITGVLGLILESDP